MRNRYIFILLISSITLGQSCGQTNNNKSKITYMDNFELSPENAHPKAKELLTADFYWSPIEESAPFGSDDGSDAFYGFREWRFQNKSESPIKYLQELINEWGFPPFDWNTLDTMKINEYISGNNTIDNSAIQDQIPAMKKHFKEMAEREGKEFDEALFYQSINSASGDMGGTYLLGIDNAIIAVGFGQFVLEGVINKELVELTKIAMKREMTQILLDRWGEYKVTRVKLLNQMISDIDKIEIKE
jgi:uncharacterized protein YfeS